MSKTEKLISKLKARPKDFTYDELAKLLSGFGYKLDNGGKTSGSAVKFMNDKTLHMIRLHKPHPGNLLKMYIIDYVITELEKEGYLK